LLDGTKSDCVLVHIIFNPGSQFGFLNSLYQWSKSESCSEASSFLWSKFENFNESTRRSCTHCNVQRVL